MPELVLQVHNEEMSKANDMHFDETYYALQMSMEGLNDPTPMPPLAAQ